MIKVYNKWLERRHSSKWKPRIHLFVEVIALLLLPVLIYFILPKPFAVVSGVGVLYFFYLSSFPRYFRVRDRQRFPKKKRNSNNTTPKFMERRESSKFKPLFYLVCEMSLLALLAYLISLLKVLPLTIIAVMVATYFFILSSLKRYNRVVSRQENFTEEEQT